MPKIPSALQKSILERWAADVARKIDVDPVFALEAIDYVFDSTLTYSENKKAVEDELAHRGIFAEAPGPETPEWQRVEALSPYRPPEALKKELEEVKSERERLVGEMRKIKSKFERFKELSETEKLRLAAEARDLEERLKTVIGEVPPEYIDELKSAFLKLKDATEEKFWNYYGIYRDEVKEKHKVAVAATFEPSMRDFLVGKPKLAPPPPVIPPRPEPKFEIGEKAFHPDHKEVTVRAVRWNELLRRWDYVVEYRKKTVLVSEAELIKLPELPPAPPRVPRVRPPPRVRVPPAPPRPLEEIIKEFEEKTGLRLERAVHVRVIRPEIVREPIPWIEMTEAQRREYELNRVATREQVVERVEVVEVPPGMLFYMDDRGRYYEVVDEDVRPTPYDKILDRVRRALRPLIPAPRAPRTMLERLQLESMAIERDPAFRKYVEDEVGMPWLQYVRSDGWSKDAIRRSFAEKGL